MDTLKSLAAVAVAVAAAIAWRSRPRRPPEDGFRFVYVNQDGTVRELSPAERVYLSTEFIGGDSGRPYIKGSYGSRDGWGSLSGFIERRRVPSRITIMAVNPDYDALEKQLGFDVLDMQRAAGDLVVENADGSITCTPDPGIPGKERFDRARRHVLADQRRREELARVRDEQG